MGKLTTETCHMKKNNKSMYSVWVCVD